MRIPIAMLAMRTDDPLRIVQVLFWIMIASALLMFGTDRFFRSTVRRYGAYMLVAIVVVMCWRTLPESRGFIGMEYEDSYVYTVAARQMIVSPTQGVAKNFLTTVCEVGSIEQCDHWTTYSGHYIGSSYVFALVARVLGYRPNIGRIVALLAACGSVILIFFLGTMLADDGVTPIASACVFAMTPVFAVNGIGAYAEPLSSLCITLAILAHCRQLYGDASQRTRLVEMATALAATASLLFAIVVKRENLLLAIALPAISTMLMLVRSGCRSTWRKIGISLVGSALAIGFSLTLLRFGDVIASESVEFGRPPFGLAQVKTLLPVFLESFGVARWYCFGFVWVLLGIALWRRRDGLMLYPAVVLLGYVVTYSAHIRSFYQVFYGDVSPYDALRYSMNVMTLWALIAGFGLARVVRTFANFEVAVRHTTLVRALFIVAVLAYGALAYRYTRDLGEDLTGEEYRGRIEPAIAASRLATTLNGGPTFVVTPEPLLLQIYGTPQVKVIALTAFNGDLLARLNARYRSPVILYVDYASVRDHIDQDRYREQLAFLDRFSREPLQKEADFEIVKLDEGDCVTCLRTR